MYCRLLLLTATPGATYPIMEKLLFVSTNQTFDTNTLSLLLIIPFLCDVAAAYSGRKGAAFPFL